MGVVVWVLCLFQACPFLGRPLRCECERARERRAASVCPEGRARHFPREALVAVQLIQRVLRGALSE